MPLSSDYIARGQKSSAEGRRFIGSFVKHETWTNAITLDDNGYLTTTAGPNATTSTPTLVGALVTSGVGISTYARNVVITVTHSSSVVAMSGVITGTDVHGNVITEAWSVTATGTSKVYTGTKAFKTVTSVTLVAATDASANSIIIGTGDKLGLSERCASVMIVAEEQDGALATAGTVVKGSSVSTADYYGTYDPNSALNGALDFDLWYLVDNIDDAGSAAPNA